MADAKVVFDAAEEYERVMGVWSRAAGERFLDWLAPAEELDWFDLGCGTGAFSEIVLKRCSPASIAGMDPAPAQIDYACRRVPQADWRVGDASALPFADSAFDIVASALVLNFIPDLAKALGETRRVLRPSGIIAGYVWERDASTDFSPHVPMERALESIGAEVLRPPSKPASNSDGARDALERAGFSDISVTTIVATRTFSDFEDYWGVQTLLISPAGKSVAALSSERRRALRDAVRTILKPAADGSITYSARAVAFKGRRAR
jgi:ubiquinone/menaquinone biosynthesis C-methylase UbiE